MRRGVEADVFVARLVSLKEKRVALIEIPGETARAEGRSCCASQFAEGARRFLAFLRGPKGADVFRRHGFTPVFR
jgi:hypothetical protein